MQVSKIGKLNQSMTNVRRGGLSIEKVHYVKETIKIVCGVLSYRNESDWDASSNTDSVLGVEVLMSLRWT